MNDNNNNLEDRAKPVHLLPRNLKFVRISELDHDCVGIVICFDDDRMVGTICASGDWVETLDRLLTDIAIGEAD